MPEVASFDYAIVRVEPRVERGEFVNAGVILFCATRGFLRARVHLNRDRLASLDPTVDFELVECYLETIPRICRGGKDAGPIGELPMNARFHWLVAPRSTLIQISPVHSGLCEDLESTLDRLFERMVGEESRGGDKERGR